MEPQIPALTFQPQEMNNKHNPIVSISGTSKSYRDLGEQREVLIDVSLEVDRGEFVAILGSSGSGKTTLLHLIGGIDTPDAGTIVIDGNELTSLSDSARTRFRRRHVGMVFQLFNLIPTLTVWENVLLPAELEGTVDAKRRDYAAFLLARVGLGDRQNTFPEKLSGGEQQRVAIVACAGPRAAHSACRRTNRQSRRPEQRAGALAAAPTHA